ncbi:MAG TPA: hypothetical protein VFG15_00335, partial [Amycolatopsis sp.]|nr:hypothetical protein [Amycolatopsis sp.]
MAEIVVGARGDFGPLYGNLRTAEGRLGKLGSLAKTAVAGGLIAAGAAAVKFGIDSVKAASLSEQSIGATEQVFGRYADTVIRRSEDAADALGLSANEYRELANVTGAMLSNAGTPLAKVADLTHKLEQRAADMAATFGGTTREAIESVTALLRGETDPIERYGVSIKEADINARLAAQGLDDLEGSARKQAEQQARLALLFEQTAKSAGQFGRESDTLAGQSQRLGAEWENLQAEAGQLLLPMLVDLAQVGREEVLPMLEDGVDWFRANKDEIAGMAGSVRDELLPPLETLLGVGRDVVGMISDLPGPVKEWGAEAAIAAAVLPRLAGGVTAVSGGLTGMVANLRNAETRTAALGRAARGAAGIGGLVLLTQAAGESNDELKLLEGTLGGAALGFSLGGPWGAAIGGVAGLGTALESLPSQGEKAKAIVDELAAANEAYKASLDQVNGALTEQYRQQTLLRLEQSGVIETGRELGFTHRELVNAALGQKDALGQVRQALLEAGVVFDDTGKAMLEFDENGMALHPDLTLLAQVLGVTKEQLRENQREIRGNTAATRDYSGALKGLPERLVTRIEEQGVRPTARAVAQLSRQYKLTPKQVRTLIEATGVDASVKRIKALIRELDITDRKNAKPKVEV